MDQTSFCMLKQQYSLYVCILKTLFLKKVHVFYQQSCCIQQNRADNGFYGDPQSSHFRMCNHGSLSCSMTTKTRGKSALPVSKIKLSNFLNSARLLK